VDNEQLADRLLRFGGGPTESTLTLASIVLLLAAILLFFVLGRKYLIITLLFVSTFIPAAQVVMIGGLHFSSSRILLPFAWLGIKPFTYFRRHRFQWNSVDKYMVFYAFAATISGVLLWQEWGAVVNRLGLLYNLFGTYFLLRLILIDCEDVNRTIRTLAVLCALIAVFMVWEQGTGRNVFSMFGGVPEFTEIREGKLRSQAPFAHAIVAGTVGATLVPLFVGLWCQGKGSRVIAGLGILSGIVMTLTSFSATPLLALVAGIVGLGLWPLRQQLRWIRWGVVMALVGLHLVMKAPVWALIQRINIVGGSSGWHRFGLIDESIRHFGEWWLIGVKNPSSWGFFMGDLSNAYVSEAVKGGLFTLLGFVAVLWCGFRRLGLARKAAANKADRGLELLLWGFGASLFSNAIAFIGIWYFDQSAVIWYALLAMICTITHPSAIVGRVAPSILTARESSACPFSPREPEAVGATPPNLFT
jgi:hypothetical protein